MKRTELATWMLSATAFILTGLILLQASHRMESAAYAEMGIHKDAVTMITTPNTRGDGEVCYILDSRSGQLFAYEFTNRGQIEMLSLLDIRAAFQGGDAQPRGGRLQR